MNQRTLIVVLVLLLQGCSEGGIGGTGSVTPPPPAPAPPDPVPTPLLVPPGSADAFVLEIKLGLEQWSGLGADAALVQETLSLTDPVPTQADAISATIAATETVSGAAADFSKTNVLVAGVDEIDPVRYDGDLIYVANRDRIQLIKPSDGDANPIASVRLPDDGYSWSYGLYLDHFGSSTRVVSVRSDGGNYWYANWFAPWQWYGKTRIDILDTANQQAPTIVDQLSIDGNYVNSRKVGRILYLITRFTPNVDGLVPYATTEADKANNKSLIEATNINNVMPTITFADGSSAPLVTPERCFVPDTSEGRVIHYPTITTVTAIDTTAPTNFASLCMPGGVYGMHVSLSAIYLAAHSATVSDSGYFDTTLIHKLGISGSNPTYIGSGSVPGAFWGDPSFLMGEHNGDLTAVTTARTNGAQDSHHLTILRATPANYSLDTIGQIPNDDRPAAIGKPGEQIYSSRISGDRAFIVTFARVDPVYIVDLSNPEDPAIIGELEIPGFSSYLHPLTPNLLLGVGKDAVTQGNTTWFQGVNVRLFDVSTPSDIKVLADHKLGKRGTDTDVLWDSHAFTILDRGDGTQRIAIPVRVAGDHSAPKSAPSNYYPWTETVLQLFELDETAKSLNAHGKVVSEDATTGERYQPGCCTWNSRSFLDGDSVYYLDKSRLFTATWTDPATTTNLFLPTVFIDPEKTASTQELRDGLMVSVFDRDTGAYLGCSSAVATDGGFSAELTTGCSDDGTRGLLERAGAYTVDVSHSGYQDWRGVDVRVQADQHHVGTTYLYVYLVPQ